MNIIIDNEVWCELEVEGSICKYKFFLLNIPCAYGGHKKTGHSDDYWKLNWREVPPEVVMGEILCDSNEEARQCAMSIERLIKSGYEEQQGGWLVGMDMADIFMQFNGEQMKFMHKSFEDCFEDEDLMRMQKIIKDKYHVFYLFILPIEDAFNGRLDEIDVAYEKILPDVDAEMLWQASLPSGYKRSVCIWYR